MVHYFRNLFLMTLAFTVGVCSGAITVEESFSNTALSFSTSSSSSDLINAGSIDLASSSYSASNPIYPASGINDGDYSNNTSDNTYYQAGVHFPATATFDLDVVSHPLGYDLTSIQSLMGWVTQHSDQNYTVEIKTVGSGSYTTLTSINYEAFVGVSASAYETRVSISEDSSGVLASGVESIRFTFHAPGNVNGTGDTLIREIDVLGFATPTLTLEAPVSRQIVQRDSSDLGDIEISGFYLGSPASIEARAVVGGGANDSGTTTAWQEIDSSPSMGEFSGTLEDVPAGGWYTIEVRPIIGGTPSTASSVEKVGVGDIFITAGQSNSANFGGPTYDPVDDRVSAVTLTSNPVILAPWIKAADPQPFADGSGGSVWSRLGDQLAAELDIPIGFVSVGVGSSRISLWTSPNSNYLNRLKEAIQYFPANGFRAFLWHQGEADSSLGTTKMAYVAFLESIIAQSRVDADWQFPWYVAEASYQSATPFGNREAITAAQRAVAHADPLTFLGPRTEDFHWENASGGKLFDGVHLNAAGFLDHAIQWQEIFNGTGSLAIENSDFEKGFDPSVTTISALTDNAQSVINPAAGGISQGVVDWVVLKSNRAEAADGSNGVFNPGDGTYDNADDSINGGVLSGMSGKHVGVLYGGSAGNFFLQTRRLKVKDHRVYTMTVSLGVRDTDSTDVFGGAELKILADGFPSGGTLTVVEADLDTLAGGSADGTFQTVSTSFSTCECSSPYETLAVSLTKVSGAANSYLDFDNVTLTEGFTRFGTWQNTEFPPDSDVASSLADPDGDGYANILEYAFGTSPTDRNHSMAPLVVSGDDFQVYRRVADDAGLVYELQSSTTMQSGSWTEVTGMTTLVDSTDGEFETVTLSRPGGWNSGFPREFFRFSVSFAP